MAGQPLAVVFGYYPLPLPNVIRQLLRLSRLNLLGANRITLLNAADGTRSSVEMHDQLLIAKSVWSPDGSLGALGYLGGEIVLWDLPPRRPFPWLWAVAGLAIAALSLWIMLGRRAKRMAAADASDVVLE